MADEDITSIVISMVNRLLLAEDNQSAIGPDLIARNLDLVAGLKPGWADRLDRTAIMDELIRRYSHWIGPDKILKNDAGHEPWLRAERKKDWRYWQRYRDWMELPLSRTILEKLDESTDHVLAQLEDPRREGIWDRRGLVVGHVQSGKTGHYIGLINKAADAGYKIIIVLAGMHNNLRTQTQIRLDEGFLGFKTSSDINDLSAIGVGEGGRDMDIRPNFATNRSERGDFNAAVARNLGITPEQRPWLFVVKKNKSVLEKLLKWVNNHVANVTDKESGRRLVTNLPLLVIDDEADHASVDTGEQIFDADGKPDEEHQPTAINRLIRRLLHAFTRKAYVGYTATPFANIFIHDRGSTLEEGPDLFPAAFIANLAAPSNYIGPSRVFGHQTEDGRKGLPLIRQADDAGQWMPTRHRNGHVPLHEGRPELPHSLGEAIDAFILACAIRTLRGQKNAHSSMLVHVTRFTSVQKKVHEQIQERVQHIRQRLDRRIGHQEILARLQSLWDRDFRPTTQVMMMEAPDIGSQAIPDWNRVVEILPDILADLQVRMINGTAKDALDYAETKSQGLKVIAIGGDKLARGLTLEGLCVSYFLRATKMYDTLMQMGRWFGYRPGYLDLCRLYTTQELVEWFGHITDAAAELREEFNLMAASGGTPKDYGLKVQSHSVLLVTSRLKMRTARTLMLSFSGQLLETIALFRDRENLERNLEAGQRLLATLGEPETDPVRTRNGNRNQWKGYLWDDVPAEAVTDFLSGYKTHREAHKVDSRLLSDFILSMNRDGALTSWTIALIGGGEGGKCSLRGDVPIDMLRRAQYRSYDDGYSIRRLMSPRDESIDLDDAAWKAALALTRQDKAGTESGREPGEPNGPAMRRVRGFGASGIQPHPERGLLFLYLLDPVEAGLPADTPPILAAAFSFPDSNLGIKVEYKVNNVYWNDEYGASE